MRTSERFNHGLMELAREARGLSQDALARACGITQATISRWEHGLFQPRPEEALQVATALQVPMSFFYRGEELTGGGLAVFYHRALQSAAPRVTQRVNAKCALRAMQVEVLLKLMPDAGAAVTALPDEPAEKYESGAVMVANAIRALWNVPSGPIPNLVGLIERAGGVVIAEDLGCDEVDALCWWRAGSPKLFFVNARKPAGRVRFSLAHELGHAIMHNSPLDPRDAEAQADAFAGEFLMPAKEARVVLRSPVTLARLASLKPWWKMSMQALAQRAKESGAISPDELGRIRREMNANGWSKTEPLEIVHERPTAFGRMLRYPLDHLELTRDDLAEHLFLLPSELDELIGYHAPEADVTAGRFREAPPQPQPWLRLVTN